MSENSGFGPHICRKTNTHTQSVPSPSPPSPQGITGCFLSAAPAVTMPPVITAFLGSTLHTLPLLVFPHSDFPTDCLWPLDSSHTFLHMLCKSSKTTEQMTACSVTGRSVCRPTPTVNYCRTLCNMSHYPFSAISSTA